MNRIGLALLSLSLLIIAASPTIAGLAARAALMLPLMMAGWISPETVVAMHF